MKTLGISFCHTLSHQPPTCLPTKFEILFSFVRNPTLPCIYCQCSLEKPSKASLETCHRNAFGPKPDCGCSCVGFVAAASFLKVYGTHCNSNIWLTRNGSTPHACCTPWSDATLSFFLWLCASTIQKQTCSLITNWQFTTLVCSAFAIYLACNVSSDRWSPTNVFDSLSFLSIYFLISLSSAHIWDWLLSKELIS